MRVGILGAGKIAAKIADTIRRMDPLECTCAAVGARDLERARAFADRFGIPTAYGSYEELVRQDTLDLIYIATPMSFHAEQIRLCLDHGRNVLCEKAFTVTARQAREVLALAKQRKLLLAEAIWTRYMPARKMIRACVDSGELGDVWSLSANLGYPRLGTRRLTDPSLGGGALLDLGVYPLNFALMAFGEDIVQVDSSVVRLDTGVDAAESITLVWGNGRTAHLQADIRVSTDRRGVISGTRGYLEVDNINNPEEIRIRDREHQVVRTLALPEKITGYEYEFRACARALAEGRLECEEMPHREILRVMELVEQVRGCWEGREATVHGTVYQERPGV